MFSVCMSVCLCVRVYSHHLHSRQQINCRVTHFKIRKGVTDYIKAELRPTVHRRMFLQHFVSVKSNTEQVCAFRWLCVLKRIWDSDPLKAFIVEDVKVCCMLSID